MTAGLFSYRRVSTRRLSCQFVKAAFPDPVFHPVSTEPWQDWADFSQHCCMASLLVEISRYGLFELTE
jgi:hypothetical protein